MSALAVWKGVLKVGPSSIPVKLYAAVEDRKVSRAAFETEPGPGTETQEGRMSEDRAAS